MLDARAAQEEKSQTYDEPLCYALANSGLRSEASLTYLRGTYFRLTLDRQSAPAPAAALVKLDGDKAQVQAASLRAALRYVPLTLSNCNPSSDGGPRGRGGSEWNPPFSDGAAVTGDNHGPTSATARKRGCLSSSDGSGNQKMASVAAVTLGQIGDKRSTELLFRLLSRLRQDRFAVDDTLPVANALFALGADPAPLKPDRRC